MFGISELVTFGAKKNCKIIRPSNLKISISVISKLSHIVHIFSIPHQRDLWIKQVCQTLSYYVMEVC